jgi:hypothetical protein
MSSSPAELRAPAGAPPPALHPLMMVAGPPAAPAVPPGWRTGPPDFVGVGAQRSGTSWWWSVISSHPDVALAGADETAPDSGPAAARRRRAVNQLKEVHFFDGYGEVAAIDPAAYHRHFPRPPGALVGEWTPRYMYDFWTPALLRQAAPDARILVMLRDPVERFASGVAHGRRMAEILGLDLDDGACVRHENFSRGLYWWQLRNVLAHFDRDQVLVVQYERCAADQAAQARRTFAFLGLDPDRWRPSEDATRPAGLTGGRKPVLSDRTQAALAAAYQSDLEQLAAEFTDLELSLWPTARA